MATLIDSGENNPTLVMDDEIVSPHNIELTQIDVANAETDAENDIFLPNTEISADDPESKPHYKQHTTPFNHISPRAAKYREGTKARLNKIIAVPAPGGSTRLPSTGSGSRPTSRPSSQAGSMRGYPELSVMAGVKNHTGTVRSHHSIGGGTIRSLRSSDPRRGNPIQVGGPINGTVKGFPPNGTISRNHGSVAFRRQTYTKEHSISHFGIELDNHERHRYSPGEEISGKIVFDIHAKLEIRFIEFLIVGQSTVTFARSAHLGNSKTFRDVFLNKRSYVIGTADSRWTSLVTPGHYVSKFKFQLPNNIPSSMKYKDGENGFGAEILYTVKARICDDIGSSSARSTHSLNNYVKILMSRRFNFVVKRGFDIHSIPSALTPVTHSEDITLSSCSIFSSDVANVNLCLDRSCFLAGDEVQIRLEIENKHARRISRIEGCLQQNVILAKPKSNFVYNISSFEEKSPKSVLAMTHFKQALACFDITLPTQMNILPSINPGCRLIQVTYNLQIVVHFSSCGGQLMLEVPLHIGPCSDPVNLEKRNSVPIFNRPIRFPHFSLHANGGVQNGDIRKHREPKSPVRVRTKYSHKGPSFLCCSADTLM